MSRQRLRESSVKWHISLTNETYALKIIKKLEIEAIQNKAKIIDLNVCEQINNYILDNLKENLTFIEKKNKFKINMIINNSMIISDYKIEFKNKSKKILSVLENITKLENLQNINVGENQIDKKKSKTLKRKFKKKDFNKKRYFKRKTK